MGRNVVVGAIGLVTILGLPGTAHGQTEFRGQEVYDLAKRAIDITSTQLQLHQARYRYGVFDWYLTYNGRWAPGEFVMADGSRLSGNLARHQTGLGGGFGTTSAGFFFGLQADVVGAEGRLGPKDPNSEEFKPLGLAQAVSFVGVALGDVQATAGILVNQMSASGLELDRYGNFSTNTNDVIRPGAPVALATSEYAQDNPPNSLLLTVFDGHSGAYAAIAYGDIEERKVTDGGFGKYYTMERTGSGIQSARVHVQPLQHYLPAWTGLPFLAIARYQTPSTDLSNPTVPLDDSEPDAMTTDFALGADDVLQGGLRWRAVLSTDIGLRVAELAYVNEFRSEPLELLVGARAMAVQDRDGFGPSGEAFLRGSILRSEPSEGGRKVATLVGVALSYSYNSPDNTTFLAIPQAHVFGVQVALGPSEMANPLVPLVRAVDPDGGEEDEP